MARSLSEARRARSLGSRVVTAGVLLLLSPLVFVGASTLAEELLARRTEARAEECGAAVARAWSEGAALEDALDAACRPHRLRVRVIERSGAVRLLADELVTSGLGDRIGDVFYGPERVATLRAFEDELPPLDAREEVLAASARGRGRTCRLIADASLRVCSTAMHAEGGRAPAIVHVIGSSRSAYESRYAQRRQLAGMLGFSALAALGLVGWLRWRVTGLVQALARDVESLGGERRGRLDEARPRELAEVAAAFNRLRDSLARADAQNEAFLADLAHEMKNPVAAIAAAAESLDETRHDDPERRARLARSIGQSASRLDRLIRQFLELARAEAGLPKDEREPIDFEALVRGVATTIEVPAGKLVEVQSVPGSLLAMGVPARLESTVRNLIDNALSFARARVVLTLRRDAGELVLEVGDDGPGIAERDLPRVFERFYSARGDGRGTGLGLAIVRATAEAHGGRIEVRSSDERGTVFELRLPIAR